MTTLLLATMSESNTEVRMMADGDGGACRCQDVLLPYFFILLFSCFFLFLLIVSSSFFPHSTKGSASRNGFGRGDWSGVGSFRFGDCFGFEGVLKKKNWILGFGNWVLGF